VGKAKRAHRVDRPIIARPAGFVVWRGGEQQTAASEGSGMHIDPKECHPAMDYAEHQKTYKLFIKLTILTILGTIAVMALLYLFVV
jgi:Bacterial aa3 type cytochrome c oxidase subunit IV